MVRRGKTAEPKTAPALPANTCRRLQALGNADIIAGIPSYNCAHTINYVIYQTAKGLAEYFPKAKSVIMISDGGSTDGTTEVVRSMKIPWKVKILATQYMGTPGKGTALRAIFEALKHLDAHAAMVVDSDLRSITPEWVDLMLSPCLKGTDFVTPLYARHKYDGTITNFLCYPFTRALYGQRIRQPIGGDFGLSRRLVATLLSSNLWSTPYVPKFGIDIFETHTALCKGFKVKQAFLGSKVHEAKDPSKHLAFMFHEVIGAMFSCTSEYENIWRSIRGSKQVELVKGSIPTTTPEEVKVDPKKLLQDHRIGFKKFRSHYKKVLNTELYQRIQDLPSKTVNTFRFPAEDWAESVYSFAAAFKKSRHGEKNKDLLEALRILWIGKVTSYVIETWTSSLTESEKLIEKQAETFEEMKTFLVNTY